MTAITPKSDRDDTTHDTFLSWVYRMLGLHRDDDSVTAALRLSVWLLGFIDPTARMRKMGARQAEGLSGFSPRAAARHRIRTRAQQIMSFFEWLVLSGAPFPLLFPHFLKSDISSF